MVYLLEKMSDYAVTSRNKQILIEAGFQHVLLSILDVWN